jgi:putative sterol carrier protein
MADATKEFFERLAAGGPHPELDKAKGTLRFDLTDTGKRASRWLVELDRGHLAVSRRNAKADCVVRAEKRVFDRMATGKQNGMAAVLRGELTVEGDAGLLLPFQRLFPAPPRRDS